MTKDYMGGQWMQLWRDVYVATIQGLSANPELVHKSYADCADMAARQADAAVKEFDRRVRL